MEASLDTNVIIHLYMGNLQSILFNRFEKIKVYEFIRNHFLEQLITEEDLIRYFNIINDISGLNMDCKKKLRTFLKRFWTDPYTDREKEWMAGFCATNGINARERMTQLATFLSRHR